MQCNAEVQKALTLAGGQRLNGDPVYKFMWSADFTYLISNGKKYEPFRVVSEDCWLLVKYEAPEFWGSREDWEANNWESSLRELLVDGIVVLSDPLLTAGPYPSQGRYRNLMRVKRPVMLGDVKAFVDAAPTIEWVRDVFPGVKDFQELSTAKKAELLETREREQKEELARNFARSRENYRGIATSRQVRSKEEAIDRFLRDPKRLKNALMTKRRMN